MPPTTGSLAMKGRLAIAMPAISLPLSYDAFHGRRKSAFMSSQQRFFFSFSVHFHAAIEIEVYACLRQIKSLSTPSKPFKKGKPKAKTKGIKEVFK